MRVHDVLPRTSACSDAELLGRLAQYAIMVFVVLIALDQLNVGGDIIRQTFLILLGGVVLALALAFGLGGQERPPSSSSAGGPRDRTATSARAQRSADLAGAPTTADADRDETPRSPPSGPASPIRSARPGTARASTSRCSPSTPSASSCACSTPAAGASCSASRCPSTPTRSGTATCPRRGPGSSTATACTARTSPSDGHRFNPHKLLLDPYAQAASSARCAGATRIFGYRVGHQREDLSFDRRDSAPRHAEVPGRSTPRSPGATTAAARAVARDGDLRAARARLHHAAPGRAAGAARHLRRARARAPVDRPPASASASPPSSCCRCTRSSTTATWSSSGLRNYWGYNTIGFFAPEPRYCASGTVAEFKTMVQDACTRPASR